MFVEWPQKRINVFITHNTPYFPLPRFQVRTWARVCSNWFSTARECWERTSPSVRPRESTSPSSVSSGSAGAWTPWEMSCRDPLWPGSGLSVTQVGDVVRFIWLWGPLECILALVFIIKVAYIGQLVLNISWHIWLSLCCVLSRNVSVTEIKCACE